MTKLCPRGKAAAKRKFKVYPSAYANAYASKVCAGKIKDDKGVKRKDFKGKKPSGSKVASAAKRVRSAKLGGVMKVKKAGLGTMMALGLGADDVKKNIRGKGALLPMFGLAGMAKYQSMNKKDNIPEDKKATGITKKETQGMALGGMTPQGTGSYIKQDIDGQSFTNESAQAYYKDLLG